MTYLLDVNVLIALAWPRHVHHIPATRWFTEAHTQGWATTPTTEAGFVRVSSNARVFPNGVSPGQAAALLADFSQVTGHVFWTDTIRIAEFTTKIREHVHGSRFVTDAHLAFVALVNDGSFVTFDARAATLARQLGAQSLLLRT